MAQQHRQLRKVSPFHCSLPASLLLLLKNKKKAQTNKKKHQQKQTTHPHNFFQLLILPAHQILTKFWLCF